MTCTRNRFYTVRRGYTHCRSQTQNKKDEAHYTLSFSHKYQHQEDKPLSFLQLHTSDTQAPRETFYGSLMKARKKYQHSQALLSLQD